MDDATAPGAAFHVPEGEDAVCIVGFARTPIGGFQGALAGVPAPALGAAALRAALDRSGPIDAAHVDEVFVGHVLGAGVGQAPTKQAALGAGVSDSVPCTGVNKVCASGMKALALGTMSVAMGCNRVVLVGGMESMTMCPYLVPRGLRMGEQRLKDGMVSDGLWDPYGNQHMGACAELCARTHGFSREEQDAFCAESYRRARAASQPHGPFAREIVAVKGKRGKLVDYDEEPRRSGGSAEQLRKLRPAFAMRNEAGTVTAGNASTISDGAAGMVICSASAASRLGAPPLAWVRACADAAQKPELFTTAPALAIPKALAAAGWAVEDVDCWEINEAFSVVVMANIKLLGLDPAKVNVLGGAAAIGHPIGASGLRIVGTLISALRHVGGTRGVAAICNGGGGASAVCIELDDTAGRGGAAVRARL